MKKYLVNVNGTDYEITLEALKEGEDFAPKAAPAKEEAPKAAAPAGGTSVTAPMPGNILDVKVAQGQMVGGCESLGLDPQRDFFRKTEQLLTFESELVTPPRGTYVIARPRQNVEPSSFHLEQAGLVARTVDKIGIYRRDEEIFLFDIALIHSD